MTTIKLMTDYGCFPLWGVHPIGNIDPCTLPISQEVGSALARWAACYDGILNHEDPAQSGFANQADEEAFEAEGKRLWRELQTQLGPTYRVVYFSTLEQRVLE